MVYLAITRQGLRDILELAKSTKIKIWCGADALSDAEFAELQVEVTRFTYPIANADHDLFKQTLSTIEDHHPGESIWVESAVL